MPNAKVNYKLLIVLAAVVILLCVGFFLFKNLIFPQNTESKNTDYSGDTLPEMNENDSSFESVFYQLDSEAPVLENLKLAPSVCFELTVCEYSPSFHEESYLVYIIGNRYRVESSDAVKIFDGEKLYLSTAAYKLVTENSSFSVFSELGIPDVDYLISVQDNLRYIDTGNESSVFVIRQEENLTEQYLLSLDFGILTEGVLYEDDTLLRSFLVKNFNILNPDLDMETLFEIPES